jgi:hypothetical protein
MYGHTHQAVFPASVILSQVVIKDPNLVEFGDPVEDSVMTIAFRLHYTSLPDDDSSDDEESEEDEGSATESLPPSPVQQDFSSWIPPLSAYDEIIEQERRNEALWDEIMPMRFVPISPFSWPSLPPPVPNHISHSHLSDLEFLALDLNPHPLDMDPHPFTQYI